MQQLLTARLLSDLLVAMSIAEMLFTSCFVSDAVYCAHDRVIAVYDNACCIKTGAEAQMHLSSSEHVSICACSSHRTVFFNHRASSDCLLGLFAPKEPVQKLGWGSYGQQHRVWSVSNNPKSATLVYDCCS